MFFILSRKKLSHDGACKEVWRWSIDQNGLNPATGLGWLNYEMAEYRTDETEDGWPDLEFCIMQSCCS